MRRGDLFSTSARIGDLFTLQAVTHPAGEIEVISFEPELVNAVVLSEDVAKNRLTEIVTAICAACGNQYSIDAEGFEPQVIAGAKSLLRSGRVALIVWEWGSAFVEGHERTALADMVAFLSECGFQHFQPPAHETDGVFNKLNLENAHLGNVFSFAPQLIGAAAAE